MSLPIDDNNNNKEIVRTSFNFTTTNNNTTIFDPNPVGSSKPKPTTPRITYYRECLKNHAATMGGTVTDGCGEFMPSGEDGTLEALKCAACNCHRNFHRRETSLQHSHHHHVTPLPMRITAFGGSGGGGSVGTESSSEELNFGGSYNHSNMLGGGIGVGVGGGVAPPPPPLHLSAKKRFRTKFTTEQKEKMMAFAEKLGWRIPREDDSEMQRFCGEVGVKRQVFKVWMHNNKSGSGKKNGAGGDDQEFN